jgi:zinc transporter ZupT
MPFFTHSEKNALLLSTLAGLSTTLGAAAAVVRRPGPPALAFLLGLAAGVMGVLAAWELWWVNAEEHGFVRVTAAVVGGAALYAWGAPRLPSLEGEGGEGGGGGGGALFFTRLFGVRLLEEGGGVGDSGGGGGGALAPPPPFRRVRSSAREKDEDAKASSTTPTPLPQPPARPPPPAPPTPAELLRLGLTLAAVMCLHNLPEGVAVAAAVSDGERRMGER